MKNGKRKNKKNKKSKQPKWFGYFIIISGLLMLLGLGNIAVSALSNSQVLGLTTTTFPGPNPVGSGLETMPPKFQNQYPPQQYPATPISITPFVTTGLNNIVPLQGIPQPASNSSGLNYHSSLVKCTGPNGETFLTTANVCSGANGRYYLSPPPAPPSIIPTGTYNNMSPQDMQRKMEMYKAMYGSNSANFNTQNNNFNPNNNNNPNSNNNNLNSYNMENELNQINQMLNQFDVEVGTVAGTDLFTIKKGDVQAQTNFPISIDPQTNSLTINTPAGLKTVTVLPDKAVDNLISNNILNKIATQTNGSATSAATITLTQLNTEPVFSINGDKSKKIFGFYPVDVNKTEFVSAITGQLIKTDETFINRLLDSISF